MKRIMEIVFLPLVCGLFLVPGARANTVNAASCFSTDVQAAINSASARDTVVIPAGTCSWTSGTSISGKGIIVQGGGAGRVIGVSITSSAVAIGNGTKSFSGVIAANVAGVLSNAQPSISNGQTLRIIENGFLANFMQGTVTNFSGGTLTMNITNSGGTCGTVTTNAMNSNCKRWLITTLPSTVILNNSSTTLFSVTEDTAFHTAITGIHFGQGTGGGGVGSAININRNNPNGIAVLIHDNFFESNQADIVNGNSNRGVIWNNSFVFSPFSTGQFAAIRVKDPNNTSLAYSWGTASTMGMNDTTGENNLYFETNDIHAVGSGTDFDDNARAVFRYNFLDNFGGSTHGADTSFIGMRYVEFYNNVGIFQAFNDGTTANVPRGLLLRGGTLVFHDNTLPAISSTDFGTKDDISLAVLTIRRQDNYPCWGAGFSTPGQYYPAVRQVGLGYVTGTGTVTYPPLGYNKSSTTANSVDYVGAVYVGDSEPVYIWNNSRTIRVGIQDDSGCPTTPPLDTAANYVVAGRDFFNNGTAKPGYTPFTYPHPLTVGSGPGPAPTPPSSPTAIPH